MNNNISIFNCETGIEAFIAIEAPVNLTINESIDELFKKYNDLQKQSDLNNETEIFLRFHLSDVTNQSKTLKDYLFQQNKLSFISILEQMPVSGSKIALEAYHIKAIKPVVKEQLDENAIAVTHGPYKSIWVKSRAQSQGSSFRQTQQLFSHVSGILHNNSGRLENNTIRTWLYVRDIDNNYQGLVDARRELFEIVGLNKGSHYIASTGIEGCGENVSDLVLLDSLSVLCLEPQQIIYMSAPDYLCPTYRYNVTFERATQIKYGDRSHYYISGTASIDRDGNILHVGDVEKQANRTLININALLSNYGSCLKDLKILIVYLRDISDAALVNNFLKSNLPENLPYIIVRGAVCRPLWLIEMEGIAVSSQKNPFFKTFC